MRRICVTIVLSLAAISVLAFPGSASAATTVGSNLAADGTHTLSPNSSAAPRTQVTGVTLPLTAPAAGVIVRILVKHSGTGADPGTWGFRVLSGSPIFYSTTGPPAELPDFPWPANTAAETTPFVPSRAGVPKGIPIAAGDRLGMVRATGAATHGPGMLNGASTGSTDLALGVHNSGPLDYSSPAPGFEMLVQYQIEPDTDRDGFGDETQDRCPTNATTQATCPVTPVTRKAKKCKKKRRKKGNRSAAEAKKKKGCKKKRKKKR